MYLLRNRCEINSFFSFESQFRVT